MSERYKVKYLLRKDKIYARSLQLAQKLQFLNEINVKYTIFKFILIFSYDGGKANGFEGDHLGFGHVGSICFYIILDYYAIRHLRKKEHSVKKMRMK